MRGPRRVVQLLVVAEPPADDVVPHVLRQGLKVIQEEFSQMDLWSEFRDPSLRGAIHAALGSETLDLFFLRFQEEFESDNLSSKSIRKMIYLLILYVNQKAGAYQTS